MLSKNWFSALTSIEVNPDVTFAWFTNLECDAHFLPIHAAFMLKGSALIVSELLLVHPGSALIRNKQGFILLYLVVMQGSTRSAFFGMLSACPEAIDIPDNDGKTPIHYHLEVCQKQK